MMRSVDADRTLHSMHSYFMRPVDIGAAVRYEVEHPARRARLLHPQRPRLPERQDRLRRDGLLPRARRPGPTSSRPCRPPWTPSRCAAPRRCSTASPARPPSTGRTDAASTCATSRVRSTSRWKVRPPPQQAIWVKAFDRLPDDAGRAPNGPGLRLRLHHPGAAAARERAQLVLTRALHRQPRPLHVVPPRCPRRRLDALRPGSSLRPAQPRPRHGQVLLPRGLLLATVAQEGMIRA